MSYGQWPSYADFLESQSFDLEEYAGEFDNAPNSIKELEQKALSMPLQPGDAVYVLPEAEDDREGTDIRSGYETTVLGAIYEAEYDGMVYVVDIPDEFTGWEGNWGGPPDDYIPPDHLVPLDKRPKGSPDNWPPMTRHRKTGKLSRQEIKKHGPSAEAARRTKKK